MIIIFEYNCYEPDKGSAVSRWLARWGFTRTHSAAGYASVWMCPPEFECDNDEHDHERMCSRLIGPVPAVEAEVFLERLKRSLGSHGVAVKVEVGADD